MRIAITVDPEIPVPPPLYGGVERIVDMLIRGLLGRGHKVTVFANSKSEVPCDLEPYGGNKSQSPADLIRNTMLVSSTVLKRRFDLVHSFARLAYLLPVLPLSIPKVMSYQRGVTARTVKWGNRLSNGSLHFTGCSRYISKGFGEIDNWDVVYNGAPIESYKFKRVVEDDAPLTFLGRIEEIKGPHIAIQVAMQCERRLIIAGNVPEGDKHQVYFRERVKPFIDNKRISYVGPVNDKEKNELLGNSAALLMPILWDEPFGIVMAEALACGTPVIGFNRGSVPEIVSHQLNGFVCECLPEMVAAVNRICEIDRFKCREIMEQKFSDKSMVAAFERVYSKILHL